MRRARMAEWILGQVLPPERAASTAGDLLEDATNYSNIWFWSNVILTAIACIRGDFARNPLRTLGLALRASLYLQILSMMTVRFLSPISLMWDGVFRSLSLLGPHAPEISWFFALLPDGAWIAACGFLAGQWTAQRAPGKEVAVCATTCVAPPILIGVLALVFPQVRLGLAYASAATVLTQGTISYAGIVAGCLWQRWRFLQRAAS